jgi:Tol biopolymer transport system component
MDDRRDRLLHGGRKLLRLIGVTASLSVIPAQATPANAHFPGSNGKIAYMARFDIYAVNSDGSDNTNLTPNTPDSDDTEPAWSPEGTRIAFAADRDGNYEIYTMNADGSNQVRLTHDAANDEFPTWSPDGTRIAFTRGEEFFGGELMTMKADGSQVQSVLRLAWRGTLAHPSWSPDGTLIAFAGPSAHFGNAIYIVKPDGSGLKRLTDPAGGADWYPDWSPDGSKIVFRHSFAGETSIWTMNPDGSGQTQIVSDSVSHPSWSPDRTKIVLMKLGSSDSWDIYTMNPDGSGMTPVVETGTDEVYPDWQPLP